MLSAAADPKVSDGTLIVRSPPANGPKPEELSKSGPLKLIPPVEVRLLVVIVCNGLGMISLGNVNRVIPPPLMAMLGAVTSVADNLEAVIAPVALSVPNTLIWPETASVPLI